MKKKLKKLFNPSELFHEKVEINYLNLSLLVLICLGIGASITFFSPALALVIISFSILAIVYLIVKRFEE